MGIIKKLSPVAMLFGGSSKGGGAPAQVKPKAAAPSAAPAAAPAAVSAETEQEKAKKALLAVNAGTDASSTLGVTSPATVTRRYLLGL